MTNVPSQSTSSHHKRIEHTKDAIPALVSQEFVAHASQIIEGLFRTYMQNTILNVHLTSSASTASISDLHHQLYIKMKSDPQSQAANSDLWNALKAKYEKSSALTNSCRHDAFHKRDHDNHIDDEALPKGVNSLKRQRTSRGSKSVKGSLSTQPSKESSTTSLEQLQQQEYDAWVEIPELNKDEAIPEDETLELLNQFQKEYSYHLEQAKNYMDNQVVWKCREDDMMVSKKDTPVFYCSQRNPNRPPMYSYNKDLFYLKYGNTEEKKFYITKQRKERSDNKPYSFSKADFKYLNKNDIEDMYYLCLNGKVKYRENGLLNSLNVFIGTCVIWKRVHDFHLGSESYHIKLNLTAPTLTILSIKNLNPYSIVDVPFVVMKEVKLKIVESQYNSKTLMLGDLDLKIMEAFEREIEKRLKHQRQMRRCELLVNERPILQCRVHQE
ncbi:hypothetical protein Tco_0313575 [Tanacetum coccineum]